MYNRTGRPPPAPLELVTKPGHDYYVKLVEMPSGRDAVGIYVVGGHRMNGLLALTSFDMRWRDLVRLHRLIRAWHCPRKGVERVHLQQG